MFSNVGQIHHFRVVTPSGALLFEFRFTPKRPCRNWQAKLALASGLERAAIGGNMSAPSPNTPRSRTTRSTSRAAKNTLLRTPVATKGGKSAGIGVPGFYQSGGGSQAENELSQRNAAQIPVAVAQRGERTDFEGFRWSGRRHRARRRKFWRPIIRPEFF